MVKCLAYCVLILGLPLVLLACNRSAQWKIIDVELKANGCQVKQIIYLSGFSPVNGADSMQWLQLEYDSLYQSKMHELNLQITELKDNLNSALLEYNNISNPTMKKAYKPIMDGMELRIDQLKQIQETYLLHPEQTQFGIITERINYYQMNQTKLLGYWVQATFTGMEGLLPIKTYSHNYVFDIEKKKIVTGTTRVPVGY